MNKFIKVLSKPCFIILFLFSLGCDQASEKKSENDDFSDVANINIVAKKKSYTLANTLKSLFSECSNV